MNEAEELNGILIKNNPFIFDLLSEKGKSIYFPNKGIPTQSEEAKGKKINATIGVAMDDNGDPMHLETYSREVPLKPTEMFSYAPGAGKQELRQFWKKKIEREKSTHKERISTPIVTAGLTHALNIAGHLFVDKNNRILTPQYLWENYSLIFEHNYEGKIETYDAFTDKGFSAQALGNALRKHRGKTILLFTFPSNPTGYTPTKDEAKEIKKTIREHAKENPVVAIIDDAYTGLFYEDDINKESLFYELSEIDNVLAIKIDGATKEDYAWGLRIGFITFGAKNLSEKSSYVLEQKTTGIIRGELSNVSNISQSLVLRAIKSENYNKEKQEKYNTMKQRYKKIREALNKQEYKDYFEPMPFNSGYFLCLKLRKARAENVRKLLLDKYDTGTIEIQGLLRIAYSSVPEIKIEELVKNIYEACKETK